MMCISGIGDWTKKMRKREESIWALIFLDLSHYPLLSYMGFVTWLLRHQGSRHFDFPFIHSPFLLLVDQYSRCNISVSSSGAYRELAMVTIYLSRVAQPRIV